VLREIVTELAKATGSRRVRSQICKGAVAETRYITLRVRPSAVRKRGSELREANQVFLVKCSMNYSYKKKQHKPPSKLCYKKNIMSTDRESGRESHQAKRRKKEKCSMKFGYTKNKMSTDMESGRGNKRARVTRGSRNPKRGKRKALHCAQT
jgi:hypothetical protein